MSLISLSLCNLRALCDSVVSDCGAFIYHGDTENTEVAQRRPQLRRYLQVAWTAPGQTISTVVKIATMRGGKVTEELGEFGF